MIKTRNNFAIWWLTCYNILRIFNVKIIITFKNNGIENINLPEGTQELTGDVFQAIEAFEDVSKINIPNGILRIGDNAFDGYTSLSSVALPTSLTRIGDEAFHDCTSLSSIDLPTSLTHIGVCAFENGTSLSSISLPPSLTQINDGAFRYCESLSFISLPPSLTHISNCAFEDCKSLSSISLPPSLTHLNEFAFANCTNLSSISLPTSLTHITNHTFYACERLSTILTSQALNQNIREPLPPDVNMITIETLISSLAGATSQQKGVVLSLIDLDRSSFDQPPTLRLREAALQQLSKATLIKTFPSFSVRQLRELFSLNNSTYQTLYETLLQLFLQKSDSSNAFLLPILEHLPLQDLANFWETSKSSLADLLASEKAKRTEQNSFYENVNKIRRITPPR